MLQYRVRGIDSSSKCHASYMPCGDSHAFPLTGNETSSHKYYLIQLLLRTVRLKINTYFCEPIFQNTLKLHSVYHNKKYSDKLTIGNKEIMENTIILNIWRVYGGYGPVCHIYRCVHLQGHTSDLMCVIPSFNFHLQNSFTWQKIFKKKSFIDVHHHRLIFWLLVTLSNY